MVRFPFLPFRQRELIHLVSSQPPDCLVCGFTGDNPATLLSFSLLSSDVIVSLGTSDTILLSTTTYAPTPDSHVFAYPANMAAGENRGYMGMLCYKKYASYCSLWRGPELMCLLNSVDRYRESTLEILMLREAGTSSMSWSLLMADLIQLRRPRSENWDSISSNPRLSCVYLCLL